MEVDPLTPKGADLRILAGVSPGLASNLVLYATTKFSTRSDAPALKDKPQSAGSIVTTISVGPTGAAVITATPTKGAVENPSQADASNSDPLDAGQCKPAGRRIVEVRITSPSKPNTAKAGQLVSDQQAPAYMDAPRTVAEAIDDIDSNSDDVCYQAHVLEVAKALLSRSDALCSQYVSSLDADQRGYRTTTTIASVIFGAVGTLVQPAKIFSALSGISSGISSSFDSGAFGGETGYLLATAILSSQAEAEAKLYSRLGISEQANANSSASASTSNSQGNSGSTTITVSYVPATAAVPAVAAEPAVPPSPARAGVPAKPGKPAVAARAATPAKPASTVISIGGVSPTTTASSVSKDTAKADLASASLGTIYSAVLAYHSGCAVRVGLNQLHNKLNSPGTDSNGTTQLTSTGPSTTK